MDENNEIVNNGSKKNGYYELPEITTKINCPLCKDGIVGITRTPHELPDGEEILILMMECNKCTFQNRDIITLNTHFGPGTYTLKVADGDLTYKIFKNPGGFISIPEADFEIEPGNTSGYMVTNIDGLLDRAIKWISYMETNYKEEKRPETIKVTESLNKLKNIKNGKMSFTIILKDEEGGSYITVPPIKANNLIFKPI